MRYLRLFKHLLPRARAWNITISKPLRWLFEGLAAGVMSPAVAYIDQMWLDAFPEHTNSLPAWEWQFGLQPTGLTVQERRDRLDAVWKALTGGQDPTYIFDTLQSYGFPVWPHEWWVPASNPAVARDPSTYVTAPGYMLVNKLYTISKIDTAQCGEALMECGEELAECGQYSDYLFSRITYAIPTNPLYWPYVIYIGGETFGTFVNIPTARREEFEDTCLKYCPAEQWLALLVAYGITQILTDGDMESGSIPDWTAGPVDTVLTANLSLLSKDTVEPYAGSQFLRVWSKTVMVDGDMEATGTINEPAGPWAIDQPEYEPEQPEASIQSAFRMFDQGSATIPNVVQKNFLIDGDMEAVGVTAWTAGSSAILSKQGSAYAGEQCLRVAFGGTIYPYVYQIITVVGLRYRLKGVARGDGTAPPKIRDGASGPDIWTGTNSTSWQAFDIMYIAANVNPRFYCNYTAAGYVEFDSIHVSELVPLLDGDMNDGSVADSSSIVGLYDMIESGGVLADLSGNSNDGTASGTTPVNGRDEKGNQLTFSAGRFACGNGFQALTDVTVACWVKFDNVSAYQRCWGYNLSSLDRWGLQLSAGNIEILDDIDNAGSPLYSYPVVADTWYHIVAVMDSLENKLYINGILVGSGSFSSDNWSSFAGLLFAGEWSATGTSYLEGDMAALQVYDDAKDLAWVQAQYASGAGVMAWFPGPDAVATSASKQLGRRDNGGGTQLIRVSNVTGSTGYVYQVVLSVSSYYRVTGWARGDGTGAPEITFGPGTAVWTGTTSVVWQRIDMVIATGAGDTDIRLRCFAPISIQECDFDDIEISPVADAPATNSGATNDDTEPLGPALVFDGSDGVSMGTIYNAFTTVTVAGWFKLDDVTATQSLFSKYASATDSWGVRVASGNLSIFDDIDNANVDLYDTAVSTGVLYHIVAVLNTALENKLYLDGALVGSGTSSSDNWASFAGNFYLGQLDVGVFQMEGKAIGNLMVMHEEKSIAWVQAEYARGRDILNSQAVKSTTAPKGQLQSIHLGSNDARQYTLDSGSVYNMTAWARSDDGFNIPHFASGTTHWTGNASSSWQLVSVNFTAGSNEAQLYGGDWDNVSISKVLGNDIPGAAIRTQLVSQQYYLEGWYRTDGAAKFRVYDGTLQVAEFAATTAWTAFNTTWLSTQSELRVSMDSLSGFIGLDNLTLAYGDGTVP